KPVRRRIKNIDVYEINLGNRLLLLTASKGHVFDLTVRDGKWGVKEERGRFIPVYDTIKYCTKCSEQTTEPFCSKCKGKPDVDKISVVEALRELGLEINEVLIASDPDTEGEKIGWDVGVVLKPYQMNMRRMEFHEVTKWAFLEALENPREVDENLVKAQIVRRVADRWVGFSLSQHLWRVFGKHWLSAGRVQTPVLGWVIERYDQSKQRVGIVSVDTEVGKFSFRIEDLRLFNSLIPDKVKVKVEGFGVKEKNPHPPFNTGELLREANAVLGLSAEKVMNLAQELFENGFITYHRTDSTRVSTAGMGVAKEYITERFGSEFVKLRPWGEGGAHECIRPTRPVDSEGLRTLVSVSGSTSRMTENHYNLYDLIFKRFIASQMVPAKVRSVTLKIKLLPADVEVEEERIVEVVEPGWSLFIPLKVEPLGFELREGETYYFEVVSYRKKRIPKVLPYTQGELVEEMRKRGIGRPSTYAKIVETLLSRGYVVERNRRLYPTAMGRKVYGYLVDKFPEYTSEEFTRKLEELMDMVEEGKADYQEIIKSLKPVLKFAGVDI
ncbi:MAG: reverse gyrase, partial [Desulfurobacteriaceae bacterium]